MGGYLAKQLNRDVARYNQNPEVEVLGCTIWLQGESRCRLACMHARIMLGCLDTYVGHLEHGYSAMYFWGEMSFFVF